MKTKSICLLLFLALLLTGCSSGMNDISSETLKSTETEATEKESAEIELSETEPIETEDDILPEGVTDMQKVLIEMAKETQGASFYVLDLDRDEINEVCVEFEDDTSIFLHEIDGEIYRYAWNEGRTYQFNYDGTFSTYEEDKYTSFYGNVTFTKTEMNYELFASEYYAEDGSVHYTKNAEYGQEGAVEIEKSEYNVVDNAFKIINTPINLGDLVKEEILEEVTREVVKTNKVVIEVDVPDEELSLIQKVMLDKEYFNVRQKVGDLDGLWWGERDYEYFQVIDLDHDGKEEVCISHGYGGDILILHEENNQVYGFYAGFRGFSPAYTDGTYWGSGGASDSSYHGNASFANHEYTDEVILHVLFDHEDGVHYYKNDYEYSGGTEISEAEAIEITSTLGLTEAIEHKYTVENILKYAPKKSDVADESLFTLEAGVPDDELTLMQKVLFNKATFNDGQKIAQIPELFDEGYKEDVRFYVVDLDKDGVNEVIITYSPDKVLILHEKDGEVYGYEDSARAYATIYTDGTSSYSGKFAGNDADFLFGNVSFENNEYTHKSILVVVKESYGERYLKDGNGNLGIEITEEEYEEIMSRYSKKEAKGYKYTVENILEYVK